MVIQTYEMEVFSPIFYSSYEGQVISIERIISATALIYALSDSLRLLDKEYSLKGNKAIVPRYEDMLKAPLFTTDAKPLEVKFSPVEFRSAGFWAEENITIVSGRDLYPDILNFASRAPFLKQERRYIGVDYGSKYEVVILSNKELDNELFVNLGIRRSGEARLREKEHLPETVILNYFLLRDIYEVPLSELLVEGVKFERGGDYRLNFILDVPFYYFKDRIAPHIAKSWK